MKNTKPSNQLNANAGTVLIDIQKIFGRVLSYWWLFAICIALAIAAGQFFLRYTTFEYSARAVLLIKDAGRSGNISEQSVLLSEQGLSVGGKAMDNEVQILKSLTLMEKVVERLKLNVNYFRKGNVKEAELYTSSPFFVDSFELNNPVFGTTFFIELGDYKTFLLKVDEEAEDGIRCNFGVPFQSDQGRFVINLNPEIAVLKGIYRVTITSIVSAARKYKSQLVVQRIGSQSASSVLNLSILDPVPQKASDILNTLIDVYNQEEIDDENKVLRNTLEFIDQRVISLVNELDSVEGGIQSYKSANEIIGNNASASMDYTLSEIRSAVQQISEYDIQKKMLESLESFLLKEGNGYELIPANLIAENPVLSGLVNQFNGLVLQYNKVAVTASERNPARLAMEDQMGDIRKLILQTIQNLKQDIQIPISRIEQNIQGLKRSLSSVPGIEKRLVEKMRTREVKEKLFLFLLQRREETALSEAITTAKTRTIDRARTPRFPVYPKRRMVLMASTLLGLLIPFIGVMLIGLFDTKIDSEESIQQHTSIPILGRIALAKNKERIVVRQGRRSAINEMFRLIRTKLNFINHNIDTQCMLVTSSISGEGKTFIALNLGITLALADKKVVLLGMDLRKPKLGSYLQMNTNKGITNYLIGESPLEEIIQAYPDQPNLSFIASGPVPPNPAELILSDQMSNMINQLKERYDYVLIDTPPVGLVSDALLLRKFVNNVLVVVHYKVTRKAMLRNLEKMYQEGEIEKASIIFNGVKKSKSYYGYGGYKQDYYVDED